MSNHHKSKQYDFIDMFNDTSRYLDDKQMYSPSIILNLRNIFLIYIYIMELKLNRANVSDKKTSSLDLNIKLLVLMFIPAFMTIYIVSTSSTKFLFWVNQKNKMATLTSDLLTHFQLSLWNQWTEFNETWQKARYQHPLPRLCFRAIRKNKMAALANLSKRGYIVLRCTLCDSKGLLFKRFVVICFPRSE